MNPVLDNFTMDMDIDATARLYHTINNKLVPILAYAELGERLSQDKKVQMYCARIHQSACDLKELIESASKRQVLGR